jgi:ribonuclease P protein component
LSVTNNIQQRNTLQAIERLKLRKHIETLFQIGEAFSVFPIRVVYTLVPRSNKEIAPVRMGFSIPKKRLKKANQRNRVKRLLKEAWRLQKHQVYQMITPNYQLHAFFIFTGSIDFSFEQACAAVAKANQKLLKILPPLLQVPHHD